MKLDDNTFTWQSVERTLNGDLLPDTAIVRVKRSRQVAVLLAWD